MSPWLAYKWFNCIKMKCIWPTGNLYPVTVSKNAHKLFFSERNPVFSLQIHWRLVPPTSSPPSSWLLWITHPLPPEPVSFSVVIIRRPPWQALFTVVLTYQDNPQCSGMAKVGTDWHVWSTTNRTHKIGAQASTCSWWFGTSGGNALVHAPWTWHLPLGQDSSF